LHGEDHDVDDIWECARCKGIGREVMPKLANSIKASIVCLW